MRRRPVPRMRRQLTQRLNRSRRTFPGRIRPKEAHPGDARAARSGQAHSARVREVDGVLSHTPPASIWHLASRPVAGARAACCAARASLGMHFRLSRCDWPTPHATEEPFAPHQHQEREWRRRWPRSSIVLVLACFQPVSSRIDWAPRSDQDSVAVRIAPPLLMLTRSVYRFRASMQVLRSIS